MLSSSGDVFSEVLVKRKLTPANIFVRVLCGIVIALIVILFVTGFFVTFPGLFIFAILIFVLIYFIIRFQKVEFEYSFTSGVLDFDKISGDFRRKRKLSVSFDSLEIIAPEGSHWLDGHTFEQIKKYDFTSRDKEAKKYVYIGSANNMMVRVLFEPSEKMLQNMIKYSPSKVKIDD